MSITSPNEQLIPLATNIPSLPTNTVSFLPFKLTRDNYLLWKIQFLPLLRAHDLLGVVDDTDPCPDINDPAYATWIKRDQLILTWIISTLTEVVLPLVINLNTSHAVWKTLADTFTSHSRARVLQLKAQLQMIKQGDSSIDDYMQAIKNIINNLSTIGHSMSDPDILMHVLAGFNSTYDSIIPAITTRVDDFTLEEVHEILSSHEHLLQLKFTKITTVTLPSINTARRECPSPSNTNRGRGGLSGRGRGGRSRGRYQICLIPDHYAHECYKRFDRHFIGGLISMNHDGPLGTRTPTRLQSFYNTTQAGAYHNALTSPPNATTESAWYPDSRASHHVTPDYNILNNPTLYMGTYTVQISNGTGLHITNLGNTHLHSSSGDLYLKNILHVPSITKNLLSVQQFTHDNNVLFEFHPHEYFVKDRATGKILLCGGTKNGLYHIPVLLPIALIWERTTKLS
ncbi:5'-3' exoribonuclease 2 [Apostasia shenzhenica]|uniref:5'-3' exoribonuclease 2 n=1 Tax=Apostasia shenzhenica TaxID=1088818 RepID=A0A2I0AAC8_9ASPA|nr:5'-3' exoribonuclease 2 [Apostasia shenzhenica]